MHTSCVLYFGYNPLPPSKRTKNCIINNQLAIINIQADINQTIERTLLDGSCILVRVAPPPNKTKNGIINNHTVIINSHTAINQTIKRTLLDRSCILVRITPPPKRTKNGIINNQISINRRHAIQISKNHKLLHNFFATTVMW